MVVQLKEGTFPRMEGRCGVACVARLQKKEVSMKQHVIIFVLATVFAAAILTGCHRGRPDDRAPVGPIGTIQAETGSVTSDGSIGR